MQGFIEVRDTYNQDCDMCDLNPLSSECQYPYCERNRIVFKIKK